MDLQQLLDALDRAAAIIQALLDERQQSASSEKKEDMSKKAEELALQVGITLKDAEQMVKQASVEGVSNAALVNLFTAARKHSSFGKVASESSFSSGSQTADDRFRARQAELKSDLGLN